MNFNKHYNLEGQHAFLSASKYHWINYDDDKLVEAYSRYLATEKGTELHNFAKDCIRLGVNLPKTKKTLNMYVNDAIGYHMTPEQPLYFSDNAFGTADTICFRNRFLRVHDLKTGSNPTSMSQLEIYNSLFCLEYGVKPEDIQIENRIYQNNTVIVDHPTSERILYIMDKIVEFDKMIDKMKMEG